MTILIDSDIAEANDFHTYVIAAGYDAEIHIGSGSSFLMNDEEREISAKLWDDYCNS